MFVLFFAALKVAGQTTGYLRFDTVKIMKQNGSCELYIINKTKDSLGLLTNVGGGLTQFIKPKMLNDSTIVIGLDTLSIPGAGGGSGISGLTAGRVTLSTSSTTVGDDAGLTYDATTNKVTTDSVIVLKARSDVFTLNWGFKPDSVNAFGNSITFGANASPVDSAYPNRIADTLNVTLHNYAVAGTGIYAITASALRYMSVMHNGVTIFNGGFNTLRNNNILSGLSGRKTQNAIIWGYKSAFANHFLKSYVGVSDASVTRTGSWFTNWDATAATGKATNGAFSMSTGAYYEYTFTDSTVVVGLIGQNDAVQAGSTYDIYIDGGLVYSGSTSDKADGIYDGHADNGNHIAMAEIITGLSYSSHTLKVENTGSGVFIADYIGHLRPARNSPQLLMYEIPYMKGAGYTGGHSSIARTDTMNLRLDSLNATFPTAYKDYAFLLQTNTAYDTTIGTDADNIHLNNVGHGQLASLAYPYLLGSNYDKGTLHATENGLYYKDANSDYKVILGEGNVNYLSKFSASNKITNSLLQDDGTYVGIGQTPSTYKLSVAGSLRSTTDAYFATSSGNVGIGTTSPGFKLDVNGFGNFQGNVSSRGSSAGFALESRASGTYAWAIYADNDAIKFLTNQGNYDHVKLWNRGGITIGHATETSASDLGSTLDVHGSVRIDKDSVGYTSGSNEQVLYIDTLTGKVKRGAAAGGSLSGSGTSGRIAYWNGASSLTSNSNFLFNGSVFSTGTTNTQGQLNVGGNKDLTSSGAQTYLAAATYTDQITSASGTASSYSINLIAAPTIAAANSSVTFPSITNLFVDPPAAGTNATITNKYAIQTGTNGHIRIQGKLYLTDRDSSATPANVAWIDPNTEQLKVAPYQRTLKGTTNWTPGVVSAGSSTSTSFTVTGASVGDPVSISKLAAYSNGEIYDAFVSATNTVTIRVHNVSTGSANYSSAADYNVVVHKY